MTAPELKIGIIGLDSSHPAAFIKVLNGVDGASPVVPGGRIVAAWPGDVSADFELSYGRADVVRRQVTEELGVPCVQTLQELRDECDAVVVTSVDSRRRLDQLKWVAAWGKPVFFDKPFANSVADATAMLELAHRHGIVVSSSSSARVTAGLSNALAEAGKVDRVDLSGPLPEQPVLPGLFWYGVHQVEILYRVLGLGCVRVRAVESDGRILVTGKWRDGRVGTFSGTRAPAAMSFGVLNDRDQTTCFVSDLAPAKFCGQVEDMLHALRNAPCPAREAEMLEVVTFVEAANTSLRNGGIEVSM